MIEVHAIRRGFAANSSSTHYLVFAPHLREEPAEQWGDGEVNYGWEAFVLTSPQSKLEYLRAQVESFYGRWFQHREHAMLPDDFSQMMQDILGLEPRGSCGPGFSGEIAYHALDCVDHQSQWDFPLSYDGSNMDVEFLRDMVAFLKQQGLCVLGGNDNNGSQEKALGEELGSVAIKFPIRETNFPLEWIARKDSGGYWAFFNRETGTRIRLKLSDRNPAASRLFREVVCSDIPELVDVSITDYCNRRCHFCYRGASKKGKHAPVERVFSIIDALAKLRVFEVAFGGGSPTKHPEFTEILRYSKQKGIVPNFTTYDYTWLNDLAFREFIFNTCGCVAFSVHSLDDIARLEEYYDFLQNHRFNIHMVMGLHTRDEFRERVHRLHSKLLKSSYAQNKERTMVLLGFKFVGRVKDFSGVPYPWLADELTRLKKEYKLPRMGVDTLLIQELSHWLKAENIPARLYDEREGAFSCFIDAVRGTLAPSSFCETEIHTLQIGGYNSHRSCFLEIGEIEEQESLQDQIRRLYQSFSVRGELLGQD